MLVILLNKQIVFLFVIASKLHFFVSVRVYFQVETSYEFNIIIVY